MSAFGELLASFKGLPALVVGDLMLDEYIFGRATRISQEAPVMVVRQTSTRVVPGGAANVARNMAALGAETSLVGVVGCDEAGHALEQALLDGGAWHVGLVRDKDRPTTRKTRVLADSAHQVLRIDHEVETPLAEAVERELLDQLLSRIPQAKVVVLSDYVKGALTERLCREAVAACRAHGITCVANAKPHTMRQYRDATLVSLNRPEAAEGAGAPGLLKATSREASVREGREAARRLRETIGSEHVLVTLGEDGMCTEDAWIEAPKVDVFDTAGAGDTVIATAALGLAAAGFRPTVFELAAQTSATVVRKVGVAVPSEADLAEIAG